MNHGKNQMNHIDDLYVIAGLLVHVYKQAAQQLKWDRIRRPKQEGWINNTGRPNKWHSDLIQCWWIGIRQSCLQRVYYSMARQQQKIFFTIKPNHKAKFYICPNTLYSCNGLKISCVKLAYCVLMIYCVLNNITLSYF